MTQLTQTSLDRIIKSKIKNNNPECRVFKKRIVFSGSYLPEKIFFRDDEVNQLTDFFIHSLNGDPASHVWVSGAPGCGKTMCINAIGASIAKEAQKQGTKLLFYSIICRPGKVGATSSRANSATKILRLIALHLTNNAYELKSNWSASAYWQYIVKWLCDNRSRIILVLDDIHLLEQNDIDYLLGLFSRVYEFISPEYYSDVMISTIAVTNKSLLPTHLRADVKSSFGRRTITFPIYNAVQLIDILQARAEQGFYEGCYDGAVIAKCAALAAQESGDAREAISLLGIAGDIAVDSGESKITETHIDEAERRIEMESLESSIAIMPIHTRVLLYSLFCLYDEATSKSHNLPVFDTGAAYVKYLSLCDTLTLKALTQRRISDLVTYLDDNGVVHTNVIYKGKYGRSREITLILNEFQKKHIEGVLRKDLMID
jgi:cell division control protein 6